MTPQSILLIIIVLSVISYVFDQVLDYINLRAQRLEIPDELAAFYDRDKYMKSLAYHRELTRFSFFTAAFHFVVSILMLALGGFGWLDNYLASRIDHEILRSLLFFGMLGLAGDIISIPFQWYSTFVIEEKFGFNKTTIKTFIVDKLKGYVLGAIIGGLLLSCLLLLVQRLGENFWIVFAVIASIFILMMNMFYTSIILPLFNKLTPLQDGELKDAINRYAKTVNFPLDNIYVIDGSRRSNKANAFFSGIGKKKKIVLYDTLIERHTTDELVAVLAHEVGHFKRKHIIWSFVLSILQITFTLFVLSLMIFNKDLSLALGGNSLSMSLNLVAFGILFSPISGITGLFMNMLSRKNEFEADAYARETFNGISLSNALKKLSVDNLSNLFPHPWYVFFHYSHPPLLRRLEALV
jgi:STE24 endopeptidase